MNKKAQSELAGFAIVVILVSILILIFVSFSIKKPSNDLVESYETESFVQSFMQFTSSCEINSRYISTLKLIKYCQENRTCDGGENSCKILNETSKNLVNSAWNVGEGFPTKGYKFAISYKGNLLINLEKGNTTNQNKGSNQVFDGNLEISMISYY